MKLCYGLIWTLFHVCWMLKGPKLVTSPVGGAVTIHCKYRRGDEEAVKYWCKEGNFRFCSSDHTIRTTGSGTEVKKNGMSIKDNRILHEFSVIMQNLTHSDAGIYLCGVERQYDIWHPVEVRITADDTSTATCKNEEYGREEPGESTLSPERNQPSSPEFEILIILKILVFLAMLAATVWVHIWYKRGENSSAPGTEEAKG